MKIIVNSKYFASEIKEALLRAVDVVELVDGNLIFSHLTYKQETQVHVVTGYKDPISIKRIPWYRAMKFLRMIPEQPVTIDIDDYTIVVKSEMHFKDLE